MTAGASGGAPGAGAGAAGARVPRASRGRRYVRRPPDLTSLFDVLFIVVFVALIRAAAAQQQVERLTPPPLPPPKPAPPAPPPDVVRLRAKALADLERELAERTPLVVRISTEVDRPKATITSLEHEGQKIALDVPLLEESSNTDLEIAYLGERSAELRVCRIAAVHLRLPDLARHLVILVPDRSEAELKKLVPGSTALIEGLRRDVARCFIEQRGVASLIDPAELAPPAAPQPAPAPAPPAAPSPP